MRKPNGVDLKEEQINGCRVETVRITSKAAAKRLGREIGTYITIQAGAPLDSLINFEEVGECLAEILAQVLRPYFHKRLFVCGLGNQNVPADALGPEVTRDLPLRYFPLSEHSKGTFLDVCSFLPGVAWANNIRAETLISSAVEAAKADCLLLIDSIVTENADQLYSTIQISTAGGTIPYWGSHTVDWSTLERPIITVGVPTAITARSLSPSWQPRVELLTGTNVKEVISVAGTIIAYALMRVCWPTLSGEDCFMFTKIEKDPICVYTSLTKETRDLLQSSSSPIKETV